MGLDMFLSKKTYVKQWDHQPFEQTFNVDVTKGGKPYPNVKSERISYVEEEVMYWRKANQIHGWFVNNCHEQVADVKYSVTRENLQELLDTCKKVLEALNKSSKSTTQVVGGWKNGEEYKVDLDVYDNKDEVMELLPPTEGFFFGSSEIDDYYKEDIENTIRVLEEELSGENTYEEYEYYASW